MKVVIHTAKGVITQGKEELGVLIRSLPDGKHIITALSLADPYTVEEFRKLYFHMRDLLHESAETGYTKKELHEALKTDLLVKMWETGNMEWFVDSDMPDISTKHLTLVGWREFMKRFRELAMDMYEVYL